ncbi:uncharacterized protein TNCV_5133221 [Trichonephila clavipes]|nr:uncharacterized protein TNCV_5133221 [Trichonephila clavipes]
MQVSRNSDNVGRRDWNVRRMSNDDDRRRNWRNSEVLRRPSNGGNDYRGNYETVRQRNQGFESRNGFNRDDRRFNDRGYQSENRVQSHRYDRVKQSILDYHVEKMYKEEPMIPIQSPYASPVVFCRQNNGLKLDNPESYRIAVDYRKLNAITKYLRYPLPLINDLITNIPPHDNYVVPRSQVGVFSACSKPR